MASDRKRVVRIRPDGTREDDAEGTISQEEAFGANFESERSGPKFETECRARVERVAGWLDEAFEIPGTRFRVGWDALLGLLPGLGDVISMLFSLYIVSEAMRARVPASVVARMLGNIVVDSAVGAVPFLGDIFDAVYKSNRRNSRLLMHYLEQPARVEARSRLWVATAVVAFLFVMASILYVTYKVARWLLLYAISLIQGG